MRSLRICLCSTDAIGLSGVFVLYGGTAVVAGIFFYVMLPETKGKTLQEIDEELRVSRWDPPPACSYIVS